MKSEVNLYALFQVTAKPSIVKSVNIYLKRTNCGSSRNVQLELPPSWKLETSIRERRERERLRFFFYGRGCNGGQYRRWREVDSATKTDTKKDTKEREKRGCMRSRRQARKRRGAVTLSRNVAGWGDGCEPF
jgi:hypothetical protein